MLAVKPLNNKEVFGFVTLLPLQISHRKGGHRNNVLIPGEPYIGKCFAVLKLLSGDKPPPGADRPGRTVTSARQMNWPFAKPGFL